MKGLAFILCSFLTLPVPQIVASQDKIDEKKVKELIRAISSDNPKVIGQFLQFPILREYPLPPIADQKDFEGSYRELFDQDLARKVANSKLDRDWDTIGWRGLQFNSGTIWVNNFADYKITAINHQTVLGKKHWNRMVAEQKKSLPSELRNFDRPIMDFVSKDHRFRIDQIDNLFRLVRFSRAKERAYDLVLQGGQMIFDDQIMGDLHIDWAHQGKVYRIQNWTQDKPESSMFGIFDAKTIEENDDAVPEYQEIEEAKI